MPKYQIRKGVKDYFKEPVYNITGFFADYLPVPLRWLIAIIILGLILIFTGFWGLVKFLIGCFWIGTVFLIVALIYHIIKNRKQ